MLPWPISAGVFLIFFYRYWQVFFCLANVLKSGLFWQYESINVYFACYCLLYCHFNNCYACVLSLNYKVWCYICWLNRPSNIGRLLDTSIPYWRLVVYLPIYRSIFEFFCKYCIGSRTSILTALRTPVPDTQRSHSTSSLVKYRPPCFLKYQHQPSINHYWCPPSQTQQLFSRYNIL